MAKRINIVDKGKDYERIIAKKFSQWYNSEFRRVPQSGGFDKRVISGDIFLVDKIEQKNFLFSIECKKVESWEFNPLLSTSSEATKLMKFWDQASNDATIAGKKPIVVFSKNFYPDYCMMEYSTTLSTLIEQYGISNYFLYKTTYQGIPVMLCITLLDNLFRIDPKNFKIRRSPL